ncbi:hypothetical protein CHELA40_14220 [Chelatococcus asaccharovorans]|nr:hypothetical protein CHELA17_61401 [Chelatococcus asaccharovorans]CAH1676009.1 hypothetical protein CHELA40_14220 [Chelatococcus asaccharovorans]
MGTENVPRAIQNVAAFRAILCGVLALGCEGEGVHWLHPDGSLIRMNASPHDLCIARDRRGKRAGRLSRGVRWRTCPSLTEPFGQSMWL